MTKKLVVISDIWGIKKGRWITAYLGYLQQYYNIVFYDATELATIDLPVRSEDNLYQAFQQGGIKTAVAHLLKKETAHAHYLTFGIGGTLAWKAGLLGLPMTSLYAIAPIGLHQETGRPDCRTRLLFGSNDRHRPEQSWSEKLGIDIGLVNGFGHDCYTDEKIVGKVCKELLSDTTAKNSSIQPKKAV